MKPLWLVMAVRACALSGNAADALLVFATQARPIADEQAADVELKFEAIKEKLNHRNDQQRRAIRTRIAR